MGKEKGRQVRRERREETFYLRHADADPLPTAEHDSEETSPLASPVVDLAHFNLCSSSVY